MAVVVVGNVALALMCITETDLYNKNKLALYNYYFQCNLK